MKKNYLFIIACCLNLAIAKGQTTLTTATDFTVTDTDGNSYNLFTILNSGKHVCIDFFFTTCPPCQETSPFYKQTFTNYGCNSQDILFLSIDNGDTDAEVDAYETAYLGGSAGYPAISGTEGGGDAVCSAYGISAYPTYILIAPNKQIIETDMWPIHNAGSFDTLMNSHSLTQKPCLPSGITENTITNVSFYPNPATNNVMIETSETDKINRVKVYDVLGKLLINESVINEKRYSLNVSALERGVYYMEINTASNFTVTKKISKQ